ncbi:MAG TPA: crossover junction endodeoxyribonuclease RuvC [Candidatus Paceibacterota bacterium]|nr:crossover junction endodeoxyribonuclease RuvC [Candidatus Paceibacterota bacterium]
MRILAIDPGYDRMGLAVLEGDPSRPSHVWSDCIIPPKGATEERLAVIHGAVASAIAEHAPDAVAIESLFWSTNNKRSALGVAEARGAALSAAAEAGLSVSEHSPQQVKLAVTGYGASDKKAVASMVPRLISLPPKKRLDDELDAIALAICALSTRRHS